LPVTRVAYLVSHPIQYQAPLLRRLAREKNIDLTVLFLSDFSVREYTDHGFGQPISWDIDLLDGYRSKVLGALGDREAIGFWKPWTVGVENELVSGNYDVVWLHGYAHHALLRAFATAKWRGLKVLLRGETHLTSTRQSPLRNAMKKRLMARLFKHVDGFLAIGTANREYYLRHGVAPEKIFMMPYAVDNQRFRAAATGHAREDMTAALRLTAGRPVILFASKLQQRKRPWDLWEAYVRLSPNGIDEPAPYLVFVGEGSERQSLEAAVASKGWNSVRFAGFRNQTELPAFYAAADVLVLPSEREPWGLVINEAMNAGTAVIVSDQVGAAADLVEDGINGYVVPLGDVDVLTARLRHITGDPAVARSMGVQSLARISEWDYEADVAGLSEALAMCAAASQ
jgi:glycosyltransferase involved in cell wall biosynthesis